MQTSDGAIIYFYCENNGRPSVKSGKQQITIFTKRRAAELMRKDQNDANLENWGVVGVDIDGDMLSIYEL